MTGALSMYSPQGFSFPTAITCAQLVEAAYDQCAQWETQGRPYMDSFNWAPSVSGYDYSAPFNWTYDFGIDQEPIGFLATSGSTAYLTFRGTVTDADEIYDANIIQTPYTLVSGFGCVHEGFFDIYSQLSPQVLQAISAANAKTALTQLVFTGHSLGSALSSLAVPDVVANAGLTAQVSMIHINLASPRVGDPTFAFAMNAGTVPTFRVVNTEDIVPAAPLPVSGPLPYQHCGTPVDFTANYLSVDGNHSLIGAYTYALNNTTSPQNMNVAPAAAETTAGAPRLDAHVGFAAKAAAAQASLARVRAVDAQGRAK